MRNIIISALIALGSLLAACSQTSVPEHKPVYFTGMPYVLNVSDIVVVEDYKSSFQPPHVEKLSDIPPAQAMRQWVDSRMTAGGKMNRAEVVIKDAHIIRHELPKQKSGVEGFFTTEQTEEYEGTLAVEIKIYDELNTLPVASISVQASASQTLSEKASVADRETLYHDMSIKLVRLLEPELDRNIRGHLGNYLL